MALNPFALVGPTDPRLRQASVDVLPGDIPELRKALYWLQKLMKAEGGVGLAANQVGVCQRFFVWDVGMVINPVILGYHGDQVYGNEGCLSFPGVIAQKQRFSKIHAQFLDERGMLITRFYDGHAARIFQHELDHLNGICIA